MGDWTETEHERLEFADYLAMLTDAQWDSVTPHRDWRCRDVVGHVIQGATQSTAGAAFGLGAQGFRYNAYYDKTARQRGNATPAELVAQLRAAASSQQRMFGLPGPKPAAMLAETIDHHQALRRHFSEPRTIPPVRLVMALDVAKNAGFPLGVKKRIAGLRLRATDVTWSTGTGPEIRGPGEALFFTMINNPVLLDQLEGPGLTELTGRS